MKRLLLVLLFLCAFLLPVFSGSVAASGSNIAPLASVNVSSVFSAGFPKTNAVDNNLTTDWASLHELNPWLELVWASAVTIDRIELYDRFDNINNQNGGFLNFSDGSNIVVSGLPADGSVKVVTFSPKTVTWVRWDGNGGAGSDNGLTEIKVFRDVDPTATPTNTASPTATNTATPTATEVPSPTPFRNFYPYIND